MFALILTIYIHDVRNTSLWTARAILCSDITRHIDAPVRTKPNATEPTNFRSRITIRELSMESQWKGG